MSAPVTDAAVAAPNASNDAQNEEKVGLAKERRPLCVWLRIFVAE